VISLKSLSGSSSPRSSSAAVTRVALSVIIAAVWAFTAVSRTILTSRIDSMAPLADFGVAVALPASTSRAAWRASMRSLLPARRRWPLRGGRLTSITL
jgi:hypothetical protein